MAYNNEDIARLLRGRTPEQQKVIRYFLGQKEGCFGSVMSDEEYDAMVMARASGMDFKKKALEKIGLDETQVSEISPVHFEGYQFSDTAFAKWGDDKKWRSSAYQISWLFFSSTQVYLYQYTFNMDEEGKKEITDEYFYKDITNFSSGSDTVEKEVLDQKAGCLSAATYTRKQVSSNRFSLVVPGEKLNCSMEQNSYTESAIQGMKAKLREKKEN